MSAEGDRPKGGLVARHRRRGSTDPGMLSTARSFKAAVGSRVQRGGAGGYYIDFRFKAETPEWPPPGWSAPNASAFHVASAQWGLGAYERYLHGEGEEWLDAAMKAGAHLIEAQEPDGTWPHLVAMPHTYRLDPPWLSAMAQGEGASLFVRVHAETGEERYADAARRALACFSVPVAAGGVEARLGDGPFFEEYPTPVPSLVLNGGVFALWGAHDVGAALGDATAARRFEDGLAALAANIDRFDTGYWSRYDLYPFRIRNIASGAYHQLHINQLEAMQLVAPRDEIAAAAERFRAYAESRLNSARAFAAKVAFRLAVPRNALLARRMPGSRGA
jgi:heparosan-N-sulfate-glucuronate 5-epimerase